MSVRLRRVLSRHGKASPTSATGDGSVHEPTAAEAVVARTVQRTESLESVKSGGGKSQRAKRLLNVFGGLERRRSMEGQEVGVDSLKERVDLKKSAKGSWVENGGVDDDSPLIKAKRNDVEDGEHDVGGCVDRLHPLHVASSRLSQMTTHDDELIDEQMGSRPNAAVAVEKKVSVASSLADATPVEVGVSSLKRTFHDSQHEEAAHIWYTTSSEEVFVDTNALVREAAVVQRLIAVEQKMVGMSTQIHECLVAALKIDHITRQIQTITSNATKSQIDTELRLAAVGELIRVDNSVVGQLASLDERLRELTGLMARLEDDWEQEQVVREHESEVATRNPWTGPIAALVFVSKHVALPLLASVLLTKRS